MRGTANIKPADATSAPNNAAYDGKSWQYITAGFTAGLTAGFTAGFSAWLTWK